MASDKKEEGVNFKRGRVVRQKDEDGKLVTCKDEVIN